MKAVTLEKALAVSYESPYIKCLDIVNEGVICDSLNLSEHSPFEEKEDWLVE